MNIVTHSSSQTFATCPRKYKLAYVDGVRKDIADQPLRMGAAIHDAMDRIKRGSTLEDSLAAICDNYDAMPEWADYREWYAEREKCVQMVNGWHWRWGGAGVEVVETERAFSIDVGDFRFRGKLDAIVKLPDGRLAVMEHKTTSDDISIGSNYWLRCRIDSQISGYVIAARHLGYDVSCVLYDVLRKPTINPQANVADLDEQGRKIVLDANGNRVFKRGGAPRETGDSAKGYVLSSSPESVEAYGERLRMDIAARPEYYYQRQEIARTEDDLDQWGKDLVAKAGAIADSERRGHWFRNTSACVGFGRCTYFDICTQGLNVNDALPAGFVRVEDVHPELSTPEGSDE